MIVSKKNRLSSLMVLGAVLLAGGVISTPASAQSFINCVPDTHVLRPNPDVTIYACNSTTGTSGCVRSKWGGGKVFDAICKIANTTSMNQGAGSVAVRLPSQYCPNNGQHAWPGRVVTLADCCKWVPSAVTGGGVAGPNDGKWVTDTKPACKPPNHNCGGTQWDYTRLKPLASVGGSSSDLISVMDLDLRDLGLAD